MHQKKFLIPTLLVSMLTGLSFSSENNMLFARADSDDYVDLGKTINLRSASGFSAEYLLETGVLNSSFKDNVSPIVTNLLTQEYSESSSYQASSFSNSLATTMSASIGVSFPVECAMFDINSEFGSSMSVDYSSFQNQFFYRREYQVKNSKLEIPMYSSYFSNSTTYSSFYISKLNLVLANQLTPSQFFDIFGTHILVGGIYGGMYTSDFSLLTNQFSIHSQNSQYIKTAVSASLADSSISASAEFTASILNSIGQSSSSVTTAYHAYAIGGNKSIVSIPQDCPENMAQWFDTIESHETLILPSFQGLIPLSSAIPDSYASSFKETMSNALTAYIQDNSTDYSQFTPLDALSSVKINNFVPGYPNDTILRSSEYEIDDSDPYDDENDYISIFQNNTLSTGFLYFKGFRFFSFKITLSMREVQDGNQEILVFDGDGNQLWAKTDIALGGGATQSNYIYNQPYYCNNIPLVSDSSHYLYIRYGANGSWRDTWINKNLKFDIIFTRDQLSGASAIDNYTTYWR